MTEPTLRQHIVEIISFSGYATRNWDVDDAAKNLGVLPELIYEARDLARQRKETRDRNQEDNFYVIRDKTFKSYSLDIDFTGGAYPVWLEHCQKIRVQSTTLILSMLHAYLLGNYEPVLRTRHWVINDEAFPRKRDEEYKRLRLNISRAMLEELQDRAKAHGFRVKDLVRTLICETVEGKFCRPGTFSLIKRSRVFTDRKAYSQRSATPRSTGSLVRKPQMNPGV